MDENIVTANTEEVVTPQAIEGQTETTIEPVKTEVQGQQVTETQAFSQRLKESTQKAVDAEYDRLYGAEYNIHSKAEYDKAIAENKAEEERARLQQETGIDPNSLKPVFEQWLKDDPRYKKLEQLEKSENANAALTEFNKEFSDLGIKTLDDVGKLPNVERITDYLKKGLNLNEAYKLANYDSNITSKTTAAQQEAIKKIVANGASSPGSLGTGGETEVNSVYSMSKTDFAKLQEQVLRGEKKKS